jgi:excisionase family DNA binding protein
VSDKLLSPDELAERWQVKRSHVYRLTRDGHLPKGEVVVELGRYYRYRLAGVEAFEQSGGIGYGKT